MNPLMLLFFSFALFLLFSLSKETLTHLRRLRFTKFFLFMLVSTFSSIAFSAEITPGALQSLTNLLTVEASQMQRLEVMSSADLRQMLELEQEKTAAGCKDDSSCLTELAAALGARLVVTSELSALGSLLLLNVSLYDHQESKVVGREILKASDLETLGEEIPAMMKRLFKGVSFIKNKNRKTVKVPVLVVDVKGLLSKAKEEPAKKESGFSIQLPEIDLPSMPSAILKPSAATLMLKCLSRSLPRAFQSEERYLSWQEHRIPNCKERYVQYGLYDVYHNAVSLCEKAIRRADDLPDGGNARLFVAVMRNSFPLIEDAAEYYGDEEYKNDHCAEGKRMHPKLKKAFVDLRSLAKKLVPAIEKEVQEELNVAIADAENEERKVLLEAAAVSLAAASATPLFRKDVKVRELESHFKRLLQKLKEVKKAAQKVKAAGPSGHITGMVWSGLQADALRQIEHFKRPLRPYKKKKNRKKAWAEADSYDPLELRDAAYEMVQDLTAKSVL